MLEQTDKVDFQSQLEKKDNSSLVRPLSIIHCDIIRL